MSKKKAKKKENISYIVIYKDGDTWDCAREDEKSYILEYTDVIQVLPVREQTIEQKKKEINVEDLISYSNTVDL